MNKNENIFQIFDPRGKILLEKRNLSNRKNTLDGLRIAILDNSKWNANKILSILVIWKDKNLVFSTTFVPFVTVLSSE